MYDMYIYIFIYLYVYLFTYMKIIIHILIYVEKPKLAPATLPEQGSSTMMRNQSWHQQLCQSKAAQP